MDNTQPARNRAVSSAVILSMMLGGVRAFGAAVAAAMIVAGCSSGGAEQSASATTTTQRGSATTTAETHRPPAALTDQQLRAHAGDGVPSGWVPVDEGDARVWVPANWSLSSGSVCFSAASVTPTVSLGQLAQSSCRSMGESHFALPAESVSLIASPNRTAGARYRMIHGYRVYAANAAKPDPAWLVYDVPQLGSRIALRGSLARRVLDTLAPSARAVALAFAPQPPRTNYRHVIAAGVRLSIPPGWRITTDGPVCSLPNDELVIPPVRPDLSGPPSCPGLGPGTVAGAVIDGGALNNRPSDQTTGDADRLLTVLHHGTTTITIYAGYGEIPAALEVFIRRNTSSTTHILELGLGRDGRVAGSVLASIRATT